MDRLPSFHNLPPVAASAEEQNFAFSSLQCALHFLNAGRKAKLLNAAGAHDILPRVHPESGPCIQETIIRNVTCIFGSTGSLHDNRNTWEEVDFLGHSVLKGGINDSWQLRPLLRNSIWSFDSCITLTGHPPVNSVGKNIIKKLWFLILLHSHTIKAILAHPSLKKCSSPLIAVMESNIVTAQASWLGSTGRGVVVSVGWSVLAVTIGSVVG